MNPQLLGGRVVESAANTFTQATIAVPVNRVTGSSNFAQVIEALWVEFDLTGVEGFNAINEGFVCQLTQTSKTAIVLIDDADMIAKQSIEVQAIVTSGGGIQQNIVRVNLTDMAGHGPIIATPNVFFGISGLALAAVVTASFRMAYRFKNVGLQEYVGLAIQFGQ